MLWVFLSLSWGGTNQSSLGPLGPETVPPNVETVPPNVDVLLWPYHQQVPDDNIFDRMANLRSLQTFGHHAHETSSLSMEVDGEEANDPMDQSSSHMEVSVELTSMDASNSGGGCEVPKSAGSVTSLWARRVMAEAQAAAAAVGEGGGPGWRAGVGIDAIAEGFDRVLVGGKRPHASVEERPSACAPLAPSPPSSSSGAPPPPRSRGGLKRTPPPCCDPPAPQTGEDEKAVGMGSGERGGSATSGKGRRVRFREEVAEEWRGMGNRGAGRDSRGGGGSTWQGGRLAR